MKLYVGNIPWKADEQELRDHFAAFGPVGEITLINDRDTGQFRGFGFVEMPQGGQAAIDGLNGISFGGRPLTVNEAKPPIERSSPHRKGGVRGDKGRPRG